MAKIDELKKQNPKFSKSLIDVLKMVVYGNSNKYTEMLLKLIKNTPSRISANYLEDVGRELTSRYGIPEHYVNEMDSHDRLLTYTLFDIYLEPHNSRAFMKFCNLNERRLIDNSDVTSYSTFKQIEEANIVAEVKLLDKESEKQVHKIYEDSEWIVLRPLTYSSSMKYGASTKWCTAMESDNSYYKKYTSRGILIYNINRKTGLKVACFKSLLEDEPEFSFWDIKDTRIDSMESGLPNNIIQAIKDEIKNNAKTNYDLGAELGLGDAVRAMPEFEASIRARLTTHDTRFSALQDAINNVGRDEEVEPDEVANPEPYYGGGLVVPNGVTPGTININPLLATGTTTTWAVPMNTTTDLRVNTDSNGMRYYVEPSDIVYGRSLHEGIMQQLEELEARADDILEQATMLDGIEECLNETAIENQPAPLPEGIAECLNETIDEMEDRLHTRDLMRQIEAADPSLIERSGALARRLLGLNRNRETQ